MPTYSFGEDSPLKFDIPDKMAKGYNSATAKFFKEQRRFMQKFGRAWDPLSDPIAPNWTRGERKAWNAFAELFNRKIAQDGPYHINDIMDDFLVKNSAQKLLSAASGAGRAISIAAGLGTLYVLLRGLQGPS